VDFGSGKNALERQYRDQRNSKSNERDAPAEALGVWSFHRKRVERRCWSLLVKSRQVAHEAVVEEFCRRHSGKGTEVAIEIRLAGREHFS